MSGNKTKTQLLEELADLQTKYDDLLYYLPDAILEIDIVNMRILYLNQMAYFMFGYTPEDFAKGIQPDKLFGKNEFRRAAQIVQSYVDESRQQKKPYARTTHQILYEFVMRKKDGTEFLAETQTSFILDKNEIPIAMRTIIRDATQRKRAEDALRLSEERFALAISAGKVGIWEWGLGSNEIYLSSSLKAILGYDDHEIKNCVAGWMNCMHRDDRELVTAKAQDHIAGKTAIYEVEHRMIHKDGSIRWLLARGSVTRDETGKPIRMTGSDTDITDSKLAEAERGRAQNAENRATQFESLNKQLEEEIASRKRMELALRESEESYRELYENTPSMYFTVDDSGRVMTVNIFGAEQLGYQANELLGRSVYDVFHEEDKPAVKIQLARCVKNPNLVFQWQFRKIRKDGSIMWVKEIARGLKSSDGKTVVLIVCEDVTVVKLMEEEREKLEAKLLHTQKLESLGVLAGGIAHDFNNLLTGILGNVGIVLMDLPKNSPLYDSVNLIESAALNAAKLTTQLLAYAGKGTYTPEVLDLSDLAKEMSHLLKTVVAKNARIRYRLAQPLPALEGDAAQIQQILLNLVTNASDAIAEKTSEILVSTGVQQVTRDYLADSYINDDLPDGQYVYLEVSESGCGMDSETQSKIFDPFFSTKFTGRGLGLAAVMGIMRSHHGAIKVKSAPGAGTTMRVLFPCTNKSPQPIFAEPLSETTMIGNGTVLVIDDEEPARTVAQKVLNKFGFGVLLARNGREGIKIFERNREQIRAVMLDMTMPIMSGERTLREIRRMKSDIPVLLSSGYNEHDVFTQFGGDDVYTFIQKPYQPMALIEKLNQILTS